MAAAGRGVAGLEPVLYHMSSDDEDRVAFYASNHDDPDWPHSPCRTEGVGSPEYPSPEPDEHMPWSPSSEPLPLPDSLSQSPRSESCHEDQEATPSSSDMLCSSSSPNSRLPQPPTYTYYEDEDAEPDNVVGARSRGESLAEHALRYYNADPSNDGVKYELVEAGASSCMLTERGTMYGHVNFTARPRTTGDGESLRFFFAEVRRRQVGRRDTWIPTCLCSLDTEDEMVGGVGDDPVAQRAPWNVSVDYCISCGGDIKHPKDGTCYEAGHFYTML
ncbi:hypothetical protein EJB05_42143, partial [Eragrostis curvula]